MTEELATKESSNKLESPDKSESKKISENKKTAQVVDAEKEVEKEPVSEGGPTSDKRTTSGKRSTTDGRSAMERSYLDWSIPEDYGKFEYLGEFYGESPLFIGIGSWTPEVSDVVSEYVERPLNIFESTAMISLLEDAVDELVILKYVIGASVDPTWDFRYKSPKERFTRRLTPDRIYPEVDSKPVMTSKSKLQRDREHIETVFVRVLRALADDGSFDPLTLATSTLQKEQADEDQLIHEFKENLRYMRELKAKVEEKRRLDDLEEKERVELLYNLQDEMDDVKLKCEVEEKFVDKWEIVRQAQNKWKLRIMEDYYTHNISHIHTEIKEERRVTLEMQTYLKINQGELEEELEQWMGLYDVEMERRENEIIQLKYNRDQMEEKKHRLRQLFEDRKIEMEEWVTFREIRKRRSKASLIVQSWWRGIMVRKKLGPYKQKKQKPEKKKKK